MSDKTKIMGTLAIKRSAAEPSLKKEGDKIRVVAPSKPMTDQEALEIGINSLRKVRDAISAKEKWVIKSLISYTATQQHMDEKTVRAILFAHLDVEEMDDIMRGHYNQAGSYLVDFDISKILN